MPPRYRAPGRAGAGDPTARAPGRNELTLAVARHHFKLLAYKDEYEVARLYTTATSRPGSTRQFEGGQSSGFHLAPPLFARRAIQSTGELRKRAYGPWMLTAMGWLARLNGCAAPPRPVRLPAERRIERELIGAYERVVEELLSGLTLDNHRLAVEIASIPEQIRGYGHVKARHLRVAKAREAELLAAFRARPRGSPRPSEAPPAAPGSGSARSVSGPQIAADDDRVADHQDGVVRPAGAGGREPIRRLSMIRPTAWRLSSR